MSYQQAMKHWKNPRKRKQRQYMGFDTGIRHNETPAAREILVNMLTISRWFAERHNGDKQYNRECIREEIAKRRRLIKGD